jgi:glucose-6-phosphate 1-dehydrogenase
MEPPASLSADSIRDEKLKVLKALDPINATNVGTLTVRGQYQAGITAGTPVRGYVEELGDSDSTTETFVALKASIGTWRWGGVPFYLRTGKRLAKTISEIVVSFRSVPHSIFTPSAGPIEPNLLIIELQPNESINLQVMIKSPGPGGMRLKCVPLDMSFMESFGVHNPNAYERLILDVVRGHQTLFMRRDEVEAAWAWIDPIIEAWDSTILPIRHYNAGSWGPPAAISLIEQDKRHWYEQ